MDGSHEIVKSKNTVGEGGSKKAVLLEDGRVLMLPNIDVDPYLATAEWWPDSVDAEAAMIEFLKRIDVPALNRKKAFLIVASKQNPGVSYELPVLVSDSFDSYAKNSWFILDMKNIHCSTWNNRKYDKEAGDFVIFKDIKDKFIIANWEPLLKPLITDILKLVISGIMTDGDSRNLVVIKKEHQAAETNSNCTWELRYFGFDFSGKYSNYKIPSGKKELKDFSSYERLLILKKVKVRAYEWIFEFVFYEEPFNKDNLNRMYPKHSRDFAYAVASHFTNDTFLMEILSTDSESKA